MSREWKPGDVALAYDDTRLIRVRPVMSGTRNDYWVDDEGDQRDLNSTQVRPLVVIDPEDREQVERLHDAVFRNSQLMCDRDDLGYDETQAALREFADPKPPKPEEPTGLGAVVEDSDGTRWTRTLSGDAHNRYWVGDTGSFQVNRDYADLDVVRVLSPGWTPEDES